MNPLLIQYAPYLAVALVVVALLVGIQLQHSKIKVLQAQAVTLSTQLAASQASVFQLQESVKEQNTAVEAFKRAADTRKAEHAPAVAAAAISRNKANLAAKDLLAIAAPPGANSCDAANELINKELSK